MFMMSLISLTRLLPSIVCLNRIDLYSSTYLHVVAAPKDFDWEEHEDQLSWELPLFPPDDEYDTENGSVAHGHNPRQIRFRMNTARAARSPSERNSEFRFRGSTALLEYIEPVSPKYRSRGDVTGLLY